MFSRPRQRGTDGALLWPLQSRVSRDGEGKKGTLFNWVNEVNPLICPKCQGMMRVVAFIENPDVIKKILKHLGQWDEKRKPLAIAHAPPIDVFPSYLPVRSTQTGDEKPGPSTDDYITDPDYPAECYF